MSTDLPKRPRPEEAAGSQNDLEDPSAEAQSPLNAPWLRSERRLPSLVLRPLQSFLETEAAGGFLLMVAALVALAWANLPGFSETYERVWGTGLDLKLGPWAISQDLRHWVNEALMTLFFFVVGLEIKRELAIGELRKIRVAALPIFAAIGGMAAPAAIYALFNAGGPGVAGWGIPVATDIAFAVGLLTVVGRKLPGGLRLMLLTLAIVDDIGAIAIIALFYSNDIAVVPLVVAAGLLVLIVLLQRAQVRLLALYVLVGIGVWLAVFESGVHATIAGVALGLLTPAQPFHRPKAVSEEARRVADETVDEPSPVDKDSHHWLWLAGLSREAVSPLARLQHILHPWTSFVVVPLFALANAGVALSGQAIRSAAGSTITLGITAGLVAGKTLGVSLATFAAVKLGLARLPAGVGWMHVTAVGAVAGIGFTVSLFIADLAFPGTASLEAAKVGILVGSVLAGALGAALLKLASRPGTDIAAH